MPPSSVSKPPVLNNVWAESASGTDDILEPADGFKATGWPGGSSVPPTRNIFNWLWNWVVKGVRNWMQRGLPAWDAAEVYAAGAVVFGPDSLHYLATGTPTTGLAPASDLTNWTLLIGGADQDRNTLCQWKGPVTWDGTTAVFGSVIVSNPNSNFRFTVAAQSITPGANKLIGWFKLHRTMSADVAASVGGSETSTTTNLQAISTNSTALTDSFYAIAAVTNAGVLVLREGVSLSGAAGDQVAQNPTTGRTWKQPLVVPANGGPMARFEDRNGDLVSLIDSLGFQNGGRVMDFQENWLDAPIPWDQGDFKPGLAGPSGTPRPNPFGRWVAIQAEISSASGVLQPNVTDQGVNVANTEQVSRVGQRAGSNTGCALRLANAGMYYSGTPDADQYVNLAHTIIISRVPLVSQGNDALWCAEWAYELPANITTNYGVGLMMGMVEAASPNGYGPGGAPTFKFPFTGVVSANAQKVEEVAATGFWLRRVEGSAIWRCSASVAGTEHALSADAGAGVGTTAGAHRVRIEYVGKNSFDGTNNVWRIFIDDTLVAGGQTSSTTGLPQSHALSFMFGLRPPHTETIRGTDWDHFLLPLQLRSRRHRGIGNF